MSSYLQRIETSGKKFLGEVESEGEILYGDAKAGAKYLVAEGKSGEKYVVGKLGKGEASLKALFTKAGLTRLLKAVVFLYICSVAGQYLWNTALVPAVSVAKPMKNWAQFFLVAILINLMSCCKCC